MNRNLRGNRIFITSDYLSQVFGSCERGWECYSVEGVASTSLTRGIECKSLVIRHSNAMNTVV